MEISSVVLDPTVEPFLIEHRLDDRPLLPLVIGLELLCEAASKLIDGGGKVSLRDVEAVNGLRFHTDQPHEARVRAVEAGALAFRLGRDPLDRDRARDDARAYLARPDAAQAARIRALLDTLER